MESEKSLIVEGRRNAVLVQAHGGKASWLRSKNQWDVIMVGKEDSKSKG